MLANVWLIPALPLLGVIINTIIGLRSLKNSAHHDEHGGHHDHGHGHGHDAHGHGSREGRLAGIIASAVVGLAFLVALAVLFELIDKTPENRSATVHFFNWIEAGTFRVPFAFLIDQLSIVMVLLVTGVGSLIHIYSIGYMSHERRQVRYFVYLNLFIVSMLLLVMANNFVLLFLGWEGVGLCSFLLIGFWFDRKEAKDAAVKAFVVNRVGDFGLMLAMFGIWKLTGTLVFREVFDAAPQTIQFVQFPFLGSMATGAGAICFAMLLGVTGKSAQLPLYVWLPDAMAGPTPVSALIHAATMVTAGVYLMVRCNVLFDMALSIRGIVAMVGALTALAGAAVAIGQYDIKKVLAYSTVSQLGYMVAAFGVGAPVAAMFHLLTHGFFKALLFLGSGSVIHGAGGNQDMRRMGALKEKMPVTYWTFIVGSLALAGIPPLAGFWSKDEIIGYSWYSADKKGVALLLIISAVLTAFYTTRMIYLTFLGPRQRDTSYTAHESPRIMTVPLMILAGLTILGGLINLPEIFGHAEPTEGQVVEHGGGIWDILTTWLNPILNRPPAGFHLPIAIVTVLLAVGAYFLARFIYGRDRQLFPKVTSKDILHHRTGIFFEMLEEKLWIDDLYDSAIVRPFRATARYLSSFFDPKILDGVVNGIPAAVGWTSGRLRWIQTGYVRTYALMFLLGVVAVVGYFALR